MTLTITEFTENMGSRRGNTTQCTREYTIAGTNGANPMSEADLDGYVQSIIGSDIPETVNFFGLDDVSFKEIDQIAGQYVVTCNYGVPYEVGYRFNFQAQGGHFVQSLKTVSAWGRALVSVTTQPLDLAGAGLPNFGGAINVVPSEDGPPKVEGVDVQPPAETFSLTYWADDDVFTSDYQQLIYSMCGKVNNATFNGLADGTTMLVRANGERKLAPVGHIWQVEFGFGYVPNIGDTPLTIGDGISFSDKIVVTAKNGLDLLWVYREHEKENDYHVIRPLAIAAYVEQVWPYADLNDLDLPGV